MNIKEMQTEVYEWAVTKGWEPDPNRTFGDECALIHSEISEALEAYRDDRFVDITDTAIGKPEGVASEFADILIRLLHYSYTRQFFLEVEFLPSPSGTLYNPSFGDICTLMHSDVTGAFKAYHANARYSLEINMGNLLKRLVYYSEFYGFDLEAEYRRKMDYNKTRAYRHGGRTM